MGMRMKHEEGSGRPKETSRNPDRGGEVGGERQQIPGTTAAEGPKACVGTDVRYSSSSQGKENSRFEKRKKEGQCQRVRQHAQQERRAKTRS
jgi:hypothetical protein